MNSRLATCVLLTTLAAGASACPMCKDSIANNEGESAKYDSMSSTGQHISGGINKSIYFMLAGFAAALGIVSTVIIKGINGGATKPHVNPVDKSLP